MKDRRSSEAGGIQAYRQHIKRKWVILGALGSLVCLLMLLSVNAGAADLDPFQVLTTILGHGGEKASIVIWKIRMPRVVAALIAGAGLSIAGCVMQNVLKNPLASPSTLGISAAATLGANLAIIVLGAGTILNTAGDSVIISNPYLVVICAFACSMGAVFVILGLSKLRSFSAESIVLVGVALGSIFSAATTLIQYFAPDTLIAAAVFWTFGDLGRVAWGEVLIMSVVVVACMAYFVSQRWNYNALANGEETARGLGVNAQRVRLWGLTLSSLITATTVSFLGMIGFIGLIGPQVMRRILGEDHRFLIPASALAGSVILLVADTLARVVASPVVLPVGAITSLFGGPMFLYIVMRGRGARR